MDSRLPYFWIVLKPLEPGQYAPASVLLLDLSAVTLTLKHFILI